MLIKGERVCIRPVDFSDFELAYKWLNDEEILGQIGFIFPPTSEFIRRWLETGMSGDAQRHFTIMNAAVPIGFIGIRGINWQSRNGELWIFIGDKNYWGKGFGKESINILVHFAFEELALYRLWAEVFSFNMAAIKMFQKAGFLQEGVWRKSYYHKGKYHDSILMGILHEES